MHIGLSFMNTPTDPSPMELARALEERGFESFWTGEHSHIPTSRLTPWPAGEELPEAYKSISDPYTSLMAAAAVTTRLKVGTSISLLNQRDIFSQAKTIATLDRLSEGRVMIGTGVGWNQEEFENSCSHPWKKRYTLLRETVAATRALWREKEAEYHGELVDFDPVWSGALPHASRPSGPPIILGGVGPTAVGQAAEWADGWMPTDFGMDDFASSVTNFRQQAIDNGRDPEDVPISVMAMQTPDAEGLKRYEEMGIERVIVGIDMELWGRHDRVETVMDLVAENVRQLR